MAKRKEYNKAYWEKELNKAKTAAAKANVLARMEKYYEKQKAKKSLDSKAKSLLSKMK